MTRTQKKLFYLFIVLLSGLIVFGFLSIASVYAQVTYKPLVGLPKLNLSGSERSLPEYMNAIYMLTLSLGALLGVLRIAWAGVKYSLSDVITDKHAAKHDIVGVLFGLAVLLIPALVLNTINPNLTNLDVLSGGQKINLSGSDNSTNHLSSDQRVDLLVRPDNLKVGTTIKALPFETVSTDTGSVDQFGAPVYEITYDSSKAQAECSGKNGTFNVISESQGRCTYVEIVNPSGSDVVPSNQDYAAP